MQIDMQIEAILKPKKAQRPKKRKNDEDILDRFADEEVSRLRDAMLAAAEDDEEANKAKQPATAKLRILPRVEEVLLKCAYMPDPLACFLTSVVDRRSPSRSSTTTSWQAFAAGSSHSRTSRSPR